MKTKAISILLCLCMVLALLSGCGQTAADPAEAPSENPAEDSSAQDAVYELRLSTYFADTHCTTDSYLMPLAQQLEEESGGRLKVVFYTNATLGSAAEQYDMAVDGIADITQGCQGNNTGRFPLTTVLELPFLWPADMTAENCNRAVWELFETNEALQAEYSEVKVLSIFVNEPGNIYTNGKAVRTLSDFHGLQIRAPQETSAKALTALGAMPITMAATDLYLALDRDTVDGTLFNTANINDWGFWEVLEYYTSCGFYNLAWFTVMNLDTYNSLPADLQALVDETFGLNAGVTVGRSFDADYQENIQIAQDYGVEIIEVDEAERDSWKEACDPLYDEWLAEMESLGLDGQAVLDQLQALIEEYHYYEG